MDKTVKTLYIGFLGHFRYKLVLIYVFFRGVFRSYLSGYKELTELTVDASDIFDAVFSSFLKPYSSFRTTEDAGHNMHPQ